MGRPKLAFNKEPKQKKVKLRRVKLTVYDWRQMNEPTCVFQVAKIIGSAEWFVGQKLELADIENILKREEIILSLKGD